MQFQVLLLLAVWALIGFPVVALLSRRVAITAWLCVALAPGVGAATVMIAGVVLGRVGVFYLVVPLSLVAGAAGVLVVLVRLQGRISWGRHRLGVLLAVAVPATMIIRGNPIVFLFQTGDMGEYVNSAIAIANGAHMPSGFPPGFTSILAFAYDLGGFQAISAATVALSIVGLFAVIVIVDRLRSPTPLAVAIVAVAATQIHFVWFGIFPVSESAFSAFVLMALALAVTAVATRSPRIGIVGGVVAGSLVLIRGDGPIAVFAIGMGLVILILVSHLLGRTALIYILPMTFVSFASFSYLLRYHRVYMVDRQLRELLPLDLYDRLVESVLLNGSAWTFVVWTGMAAALAGLAGALVAARPLCVLRTRSQQHLIAGVVIAVILSVGTFSLLSAVSTFSGLVLRVGLLFSILTAVAFAVVSGGAFRRRGLLVAVTMVGLLGVLPAALYAVRLPEPINHAYYLYWDRYMYAAALPAAIVLLAVASGWLLSLNRANEGIHRWSNALVIAVVFSLVWFGWGKVEAANADAMFGDTVAALDSVAAQLSQTSGKPAFYAGGDLPLGWFFPNTYRAIGLPLEQSFGVDFENLPSDPFGPDPSFEDALTAAISTRGKATVLFVDACDFHCAAAGEGPQILDDGTWAYRYRVPVNSGMQPLSDWSIPWLIMTISYVTSN